MPKEGGEGRCVKVCVREMQIIVEKGREKKDSITIGGPSIKG